MLINNKKVEIVILTSKKVNINDIPRLCIHGNDIERITIFKLLGIFISSDLLWDYMLHIYLKKLQSKCTALII